MRATLLLLLFGSAACSHHVRMVTPDTTGASTYVCSPGDKDQKCAPAETLDPRMANEAGTANITLPRECAGRFHQILVRDADSSKPKVYVTCAPTEAPIGDME